MARIISLRQGGNSSFGNVGLEPGDYLKLKNPHTQFVDKVTGFKIKGSEVKMAPDSTSQKLSAAIRSGTFSIIKKADWLLVKRGEVN